MKRAIGVVALALAILGCHHAKKPHAHYSARLDDGVLRVVVIGDSLAFGAGDETGGGIPGRLPNELRAHHSGTIDVQNLGANGATTEDVQARLREQSVRDGVYIADVIVLSVGANDAFQTTDLRAQAIAHREEFAKEILQKVAAVVSELRAINPDAEILILGGYNPFPENPLSSGINSYMKKWDSLLDDKFAADPYVDVVKLSDILDGPDKLSSIDHFHPSGASYAAIAKRIAEMMQ